MTSKITFRCPEEMREEIEKVFKLFEEDGMDSDESKIVRFLINKGLEKLKLEGRLK